MLEFCQLKNLYIAFGVLVLIPICWLKTFKGIAYISFFANISILFALVVIMSYAFDHMEERPDLKKDVKFFEPSNLPLFFGIAVFNFEGNGVILNLHASMKNPEDFYKIMKRCIACIIVILVVFSAVSYRAYSSETEDMITLNLPHDNLTSFVQLCYSFGLLCTYPIQFIPAIDIAEKAEMFDKLPTWDKFPRIKSMVLRSILVALTGIGAMIVPKFGLFINLSGALVCTALAFILPVSNLRNLPLF
jgi:proton-coupled amino acid transporter